MSSCSVCFKPIGYVRTVFRDDEVRSAWPHGVEGFVEVLEEYAEGLKGLEGFSHVLIVAYLHRVPEEARRTLKAKPRRLTRFGFKLEELPEVGVFALDSPHRPNPIAVTIAELVRIEGNKLYVKGLDLYDGTPVLDIRPYTPDRVVDPGKLRLAEWYRELYEKARKLGLQSI
jgi:tRNA-Thr(GGU) m(6)t(6)A37 methyltransferase TsaA